MTIVKHSFLYLLNGSAGFDHSKVNEELSGAGNDDSAGKFRNCPDDHRNSIEYG
jgi:hypothetical protein